MVNRQMCCTQREQNEDNLARGNSRKWGGGRGKKEKRGIKIREIKMRKTKGDKTRKQKDENKYKEKQGKTNNRPHGMFIIESDHPPGQTDRERGCVCKDSAVASRCRR